VALLATCRLGALLYGEAAGLVGGLALATMLDRTRGREIRLFAGGGLAVLERLEALGYDAFSARPTLSRWAKMALVARALVGGGA